MPLDTRVAQTTLENALRDTVLCALGQRLPSVASIAALRAVATRGAASSMRSDDDLICVGSGTVTAFRWNSISAATDDGATVIQPSDVTGNGRWLAWTSPLRFSTSVGGDSVTLDQITSGPLRRVIVLDKSMSDDETLALVTGQMPSVVIEAIGDTPADATQATGSLWLTDYEFTVSVISRNLRDRREAAQGSGLSEDVDTVGANAIDGFIKALIGGTSLTAIVDGIRNVKVGHADNTTSDFGERFVIRSRSYTIQATEEFPNAPNEFGAAQEVDVQAHMADLGDQPGDFDALNYITSGMLVTVDSGFMQQVSAGSAVIAGTAASYAGTIRSFAAMSDIYRDLSPAGTMTYVTVSAGSDEPAVTPGSLRIGVCRTDSSGVISDRYIAASQAPYMGRNQIPLA